MPRHGNRLTHGRHHPSGAYCAEQTGFLLTCFPLATSSHDRRPRKIRSGSSFPAGCASTSPVRKRAGFLISLPFRFPRAAFLYPDAKRGGDVSNEKNLIPFKERTESEQREKTHRSESEAREFYKRSPSEARESRFNFEGTSRTERRGNAENVTGHMTKYDEIPKEAKRAARLFRKNPINLAAADPAPKSSNVVKRDLSRSQAHRATHRARGITIMPIKENAASERHSSTRAQP